MRCYLRNQSSLLARDLVWLLHCTTRNGDTPAQVNAELQGAGTTWEFGVCNSEAPDPAGAASAFVIETTGHAHSYCFALPFSLGS